MHILLVGAWPELANQLVGLPARVTLIQTPSAGGGRETGWAHRYLEVDYADATEAVRVAGEIHHADPIDVVVGLREFSLPAVAAIARELGIACIPGPVETLGQDKAAVRAILNGAGCRTVAHQVCGSATELAEFAARTGYPVIVKPAAGAGSAGVHAVASGSEIEAAWSHASAAGGGVLAEQMLIGPEFSAEVRSVNGRHEVVAITEKLTTGAPHFVEAGHVVPALIGATEVGAISAEAVRALTAIGHQTGPSHVELMLTPDGPAIIEINRRLGGDRIWELVALATGRNIMFEALADACGEPLRAAAPAGRAAAIRFLLAGEPATVAAAPVTGGPAIAALVTGPELIRAQVTVEPGSRVMPARASQDRLGYVLTFADGPDAAAKAADSARDTILDTLLTSQDPED